MIAPNRNTKWLSSGALTVLAVAGATQFAKHYESGDTATPTTAYRDIVGVWTVCDGRTQGVTSGMTQTVAQCEAWLQRQMAANYATVRRCITQPLTLGQAIAFTDAVHNLGPGVVCGSTLQAYANAGRMDDACLQLVDAKGGDGLPTGFTKAGGRVADGLLYRREAAVAVCLRGLQ